MGLRYIKAAGGDPPGEESAIKTDDLAALIGGTVSGLQRHIARFDLPETPYSATRRAGFNYEFDVFAQLARVAEWSAAGSAGDPDSGGGDEEGGA
jgi:ATP-dependent helicase/nuclease subunit B